MLAFGGYALLLPLVPVHAAAGGASPAAAGATTGVFMAATVATQLTVPTVLRRTGPRAALILGAVALGVPAALLAGTAALPVLFAVAVVRGIGFGLVTVTGAALVADLAPPSRRGRAIGLYGVALGLPQLVLLSGGVWAYEVLDPTVVLLAGAVMPLVAAVCCARLPTTRAAPRDRTGSLPATVAMPPWTAMVVSAAAAGGVITVLPLWAPSGLAGGTGTAAIALAVLTAGQLAGRGLAGELADRPGARLRTPVPTLAGLAVVALGAAVVAVGGSSAGLAVLAGATLVGLGFGAVQSDTLLALFARAGPTRSGAASTWWNTAYDAGTGLGAAALSAVFGAAGGSAAFVVAALAGLAAAPVVLWSRGARGSRGSERRAPSLE
ncbi:putative MFS family arabinose efflux permease [Actinomycetospora succinea]|uniref:Putative MFS family arabinose efflux permease n=1 Tax=Actinomycetospora succinea TaxID=663603 RepID=A0A4R6VIW2_9PSEU|nr:MFS transporter [Actinomycetospora succinea]TDQ58429.1 putative MFS family arabinose efflux permease [Actinomycetospora succinea]